MKIINSLKNEKGQSMVELAIALPVLLLILCGIIDFGWLFYNKLAISNCSREGARYAVVNSEKSDIVSLTTNKVSDTAPQSLKDNITVSISFSNDSSKSSGDVTVSVNSRIKILTPVLGIFYKNQEAEIGSFVTMKVE